MYTRILVKIHLQIKSMAIFKTQFILLFIISITHFSSSSRTNPTADIHSILPKYGLPPGLFPKVLNSYTLSSDGTFEIHLESSCYVQFDDQIAYYDKTIKGKLSYGSVSSVSGIQAKKLFLWVSVTGMDVDSDPGFIDFHVGALSKKLNVKLFEDVPECKKKAVQAI